MEDPATVAKDNTAMDLTEIGSEGVEYIQLAQDREHKRATVNKEITLHVP
jgi:hypothetical protein